MQHHTSSTPDPVLVGSVWIDQAHKHRLVEVIRVIDDEHVLIQPVRDAQQRPASYLETTEQLAGQDYQRLVP
jgi:hypothetical protein